jgi:hypothetical protein
VTPSPRRSSIPDSSARHGSRAGRGPGLAIDLNPATNPFLVKPTGTAIYEPTDKRLVKAMTDSTGAGLTWPGDDTVSPGRDVMHFDMRGVGPIKKIWTSAAAKDTYLGNG